jgi:hypothetical protein
MNRRVQFALPLLLAAAPAFGATLQSDCRGPGNIGVATMSADGTLTLQLHAAGPGPITETVMSYHRGDPQYARMLSHIGGIHPGEHKPVPPWC